jgi:hypothetical protein
VLVFFWLEEDVRLPEERFSDDWLACMLRLFVILRLGRHADVSVCRPVATRPLQKTAAWSVAVKLNNDNKEEHAQAGSFKTQRQCCSYIGRDSDARTVWMTASFASC